MSNLLKNLLIALGLAIILFMGYMLFFRDSGAHDGIKSDGTFSADAEQETQQLLASLNELKSFKIDGHIFSDQLFASLRDFRVELGTEASGRPNPFSTVR